MEKREIDNTYGLAAVQGELLDIMKFIHRICAENGIAYSLTGGSLLGAVRHDGFIPWDDDFDIMFDRENYERFLACMREYEGGDFLLERDQWVYRIRAERKTKVFVPSVDLFVLDKVPENKLAHKWQILRLRVLQGMLRNNELMRDFSLVYRLCIAVTSWLGRLFNKEKLFALYDRISRCGNGGNSGRLAIFNDCFRLLSRQYDANLMDGTELHAFEDTELSIICRYDDYLTCQFGDYMTLPPEAERIPQHMG